MTDNGDEEVPYVVNEGPRSTQVLESSLGRSVEEVREVKTFKPPITINNPPYPCIEICHPFPYHLDIRVGLL